jgi:anti-sigma B factor antagonist
MTSQHRRPPVLSVAVGEVTVVCFQQPRVTLDEETAHAVSDELRNLAEEATRSMVFFDFGGVHYLTSTMLGVLIDLHKRLRAAGGQLIVQNVQPQVYSLFEVTCLTRLFSVRPAASPPVAPG